MAQLNGAFLITKRFQQQKHSESGHNKYELS